MAFLEAWLLGAILVLAYMTAIWLVSLRVRDASIVDIAWGPGLIVLAGSYIAFSDRGVPARQTLVFGLVAVWGLRLALYIGWRSRGRGEDYRYQTWRDDAGESFWWTSYFEIFLLQGFFMWLISATLLAALHAAAPDQLTALDWLGAALWGVGAVFETVGDWQLARFRRRPANRERVLQGGLWHYTRHPNYFGEAVLWWGYYVIALGAGGWWTIFGPVVMTYLLVRVSGVAMLERHLTESRPGYRDYMQSTNAFFPWFPHKKA